MEKRCRARVACLLTLTCAAALIATGPRAAAAPSPSAPATLPGWGLYDRYCLACHGSAGDGRGPAAPWLWPRPRAFSAGIYKWRSTPLDRAPTDDDLRAVVRWGAPGTSMPGFADVLDAAQIDEVIDVVKAFAPAAFAGKVRPTPARAPAPTPPSQDPAVGAAIWQRSGCAMCHGEGGRGDGPAATSLRDAEGRPAAPYDLTASPLRRPRGPTDNDALVAIRDSITHGLSGTPMLGFADRLSADEVWALARFVDRLRYRGTFDLRAATITTAAAIAADKPRVVVAGSWPGAGDPEEALVFGAAVPSQGPPPAALAPAQKSLRARQCARCHAKQVREWSGSLHARAASPGLLAQLTRIGTSGAAAARLESCLRCHAPLAEQLPIVRQVAGAAADAVRATNPDFDAGLRDEGVTCAGCHLRGWTRQGPPAIAASLLPSASYPTQPLALYERSDLCLPCHQLPPRLAVDGRPLLDTYREWLEGPYMRRGIQCQHCHMPNREHTFRGVHDPDTFRQGIAVRARAHRDAGDGAVVVRASVENVGAGHFLPTTPTPAAWLRIELVDGAGDTIPGARRERRIGRHIEQVDGVWRVIEDTRIPQGERLLEIGVWRGGGVGDAVAALVTVEVHPDDYYEGLYQQRLRGKLEADARAGFEVALARARASHYVAYQATVPIGDTP